MFMNFGRPEAADEEFQAHQVRLARMSRLFWQRMTDMITGPEHEYVYLKRLVKRFHQRNKRADKIRQSYKLGEQECNRIKRKLLASKGGTGALKAAVGRSTLVQSLASPTGRGQSNGHQGSARGSNSPRRK